MSIKATIPLKPTVDLGDYKTIRKTREPVDVEDSKVTDVLEQIRYNATPWEPSSSPVAFDDLVTVDVNGKIENTSICHVFFYFLFTAFTLRNVTLPI